MLTPAELKKKQLLDEKKKRFYDMEEVDAVLEELNTNYQELYTKYTEMTQNVKKLSDGIQYYKSIETTLQKALVLAEKTAKETKDAAEAKASEIETEAQKKAKEIVSSAEKERDTIKLQCNHLVDLFKQYKSQFIQVTSNNLKLLNSKEFEIDSPELEKMYQENKPETELGIKKQLENTQDLVAAISSNLSNPSTGLSSAGASSVASAATSTTDTASTTGASAITAERTPKQTVEAVKEEVDNVQPPKIQYNSQPATASQTTADVSKVPKEAETEKEVKTATETKVTLEDTKDLSENTNEVEKAANTTASNETNDKDTDTKENGAAKVAGAKEIPTLDPPVKEEKTQTLDALLNDLNMNGKKSNDEDPFEFLGSLDDF